MIEANGTQPLQDFRRHIDETIERLKETGDPEVLTVEGRAELVVQDAGAYQKLVSCRGRCGDSRGFGRRRSGTHETSV